MHRGLGGQPQVGQPHALPSWKEGPAQRSHPAEHLRLEEAEPLVPSLWLLGHFAARSAARYNAAVSSHGRVAWKPDPGSTGLKRSCQERQVPRVWFSWRICLFSFLFQPTFLVSWRRSPSLKPTTAGPVLLTCPHFDLVMCLSLPLLRSLWSHEANLDYPE